VLEPDPQTEEIITDPDWGGPQCCGSDGSGSETLDVHCACNPQTEVITGSTAKPMTLACHGPKKPHSIPLYPHTTDPGLILYHRKFVCSFNSSFHFQIDLQSFSLSTVPIFSLNRTVGGDVTQHYCHTPSICQNSLGNNA
jgi:hypothetical protein